LRTKSHAIEQTNEIYLTINHIFDAIGGSRAEARKGGLLQPAEKAVEWVSATVQVFGPQKAIGKGSTPA
jgi:hypothetical protein